jgi:hypothetical protein
MSMQFLSNFIRILPKKMLLLSPVAMLSLSIPFSVASPAQASEYTSVVCYFQKDFTDPTWQWGLKPDNGWYKLQGRWIEEGVYKFETSTSRDEIVASCRKSQEYYNHGDKRLIGIYAANSSLGRNYLIYVNGQEVKP